MDPKFGIDVSMWQGDFNFATAGADFVIIKFGGSDAGRYKDSQAENNYAKCKKLNIPVGAYYFGCDLSVAEAIQSAKHFISLLAGHQFEYPVYYDVEGEMLSHNNHKETLGQIIDAFCKTVQDAGYYVGVYTNAWVYEGSQAGSELKKYTPWVASWTSQKPSLPSNTVDLWQFGGSENHIRSRYINGQIVDQSFAFKDFPSIIKNGGFNGFKKDGKTSSTPVVTHKSNQELAAEVMQGKWGVGADRKSSIEAAGYSYYEVQKIVNSWYNVACEVVVGKWSAGAERKEKLTKAGYPYDIIQSIVNSMLNS